MTLPFHTDFYQRDADIPGLKAEYTITMYLNDDYDGGEIDFRIFNSGENDMRIVGDRLVPIDENYGEVPEIAYRPQAGDVIIFPSRPPFYHGVRRVTQGTKYFARMF
jgi:predicted 2-oxoglutarate/Fe(II)-dependent dioxygenase YbiX